MELRRVSKEELVTEMLEEFGLSNFPPDSREVVGELIRRIAVRRCPISPSKLHEIALGLVKGLVWDRNVAELIETGLQSLLASGDLYESWETSDQTRRRVVYVSQPSFATIHKSLFLIGSSAHRQRILPGELMDLVEHRGAIRVLSPFDSDIVRSLHLHGLVEVRHDDWLWAPGAEKPNQYIQHFNRKLELADTSGDIRELLILDPSASVSYYKGRWRQLKTVDSGQFVARRGQLYGSRAWSYVEVLDGLPIRFIDLPVEGVNELRAGISDSAPDQAWRLQAAIDAERKNPQNVLSRRALESDVLLDFLSPVPSWFQRRLEVFGKRTEKSRGALMTFAVPRIEALSLIEMACDRLWMDHVES